MLRRENVSLRTSLLCVSLLASWALASGCSTIGEWFDDAGDGVEDAVEEVEDEIDDAT